ncbi:hypothetical protein K491DRAFT_696810 [Lophiostoma macrostomum CBS 122681]|uniref:Uncharacterized protein n=1 Tax=Lophiostoma macrostomum CBS 122681 TaxID=1314788 RepID=A0A6A6STE7_9PLEO|nr:hypothetical protein K491DRAFT_696810 [Lophiostoma macrostomum CBS 122681]
MNPAAKSKPYAEFDGLNHLMETILADPPGKAQSYRTSSQSQDALDSTRKILSGPSDIRQEPLQDTAAAFSGVTANKHRKLNDQNETTGFKSQGHDEGRLRQSMSPTEGSRGYNTSRTPPPGQPTSRTLTASRKPISSNIYSFAAAVRSESRQRVADTSISMPRLPISQDMYGASSSTPQQPGPTLNPQETQIIPALSPNGTSTKWALWDPDQKDCVVSTRKC